MMRTPLIAGNWKMNMTISQTRDLISRLVPLLRELEEIDKVICPPFTSIHAAADLLINTGIGLGAQNLFWEPKGAYTGEISPGMVAELCQYVIIGHSERRAYFSETDERVNKKIQAALTVGLQPILCVGETLEENETGQTAQVITRQILMGLHGIDLKHMMKVIIAYEPVWAIGTGRAATPDLANKVCQNFIRPPLAGLYDEGIAGAIRILYGGSVKAHNAAEYFSQSDIDGALVGGASLQADEFVLIAKATCG